MLPDPSTSDSLIVAGVVALPGLRRISTNKHVQAALAAASLMAGYGCSSPSEPTAAERELVVSAVEPPGSLADTSISLRVLGSGFESESEVEFELDGQAVDLLQVMSTTFVNDGLLLTQLQIGKGAVNALYGVRVRSGSKRGIPIETFEVFVTPGLLDLLPGDFSGQAMAINENGEVVGTSWNGAGRPQVFYYRDSTLEEVGEGEAWDISNSGRAVGYRFGTALVWERIGGQWIATALPKAGRENFAYSITSRGDMVAGTSTGGLAVGLSPILWRFVADGWQVFRLPTGGSAMSAVSINDTQMVLGNLADWSQPVVWVETEGQWDSHRLPRAAGEEVNVGNEINDHGDVVGFVGEIPQRGGVIWRKTPDGWAPPVPTTDIGIDNRANAINNLGEVTGVSVFPGEFDRAFFFNRSGDLLNLGAPLPPYSLAIDVNDHGVIVGATGGDPNGLFRPVIWPVVYRR